MTSFHDSRIIKWLSQSPPGEWALLHLRELLIGALRQGPVPQHVAFVMDGNRRFARHHKIETVEGHSLGFEALGRILEVCYKIGVKVVTIYAFSVENFKRSKYEVDALMEMAKLRLAQLLEHDALLEKYGACIRVLGQRELISEDLLSDIKKATEITKKNRSAVLNVCFPYTSRDEITSAIRSIVSEYSQPSPNSRLKRPFSESHIARNIRTQRLSTLKEESESRSSTPDPTSGHEASPNGDEQDQAARSAASVSSSSPNGDSTPNTSYQHSPEREAPIESTFPDPENITVDTLDEHMHTAGTPPLDLLVRTSGVERLSDFMLWQCHEQTSIVFLKCLWPEFDLWQFLPVLVEWQWWRGKVEDAQRRDKSGSRLVRVKTA